MDQKALWKQYLQVLNQTVQPGPGQVIHTSYPYGQWQWGGREPTDGSLPYAQWTRLNVVPATPSINLDAQSNQSGFDVAYRDWFESLTVGDLGKDAHYTSLQDEVSQVSDRKDKVIQEANAQWSQERQAKKTTLSFTDWLKQLQNSRFNDPIQMAENDYRDQVQELRDYRKRIESPVSDISAAYYNDDYMAPVVDPVSSKSIQVRAWTTNPVTSWDYVNEITGGNFGGDATSGTRSAISFDNQSNEYDYSSTEVSMEGGIGMESDDGGFLALGGSGGYKKIDTTKASSTYRFQIEWQDLKRIPISPSGWYAGSNLETYGRGENYMSGVSAFSNGGADYFFGAGGSLSRIYDSMIVAYRPKVSIDAGSEFAHELYKSWHVTADADGLALGSGVIGSLEFSGSASQESKSSVVKQSGSTVSIESRGDWPLILGFVSSWTLAPK